MKSRKPKEPETKTISERMAELLADEPEAHHYSATKWAEILQVNTASVKRSPKWIDLRRADRAGELSYTELAVSSVGGKS